MGLDDKSFSADLQSQIKIPGKRQCNNSQKLNLSK